MQKKSATKTPRENGGSPKETNSLLKEILSWVEIIVIATVLALFINNFIIVNATVPSGSMENTIKPGDRLLGFRFSYWFSEPERGDIVVFRYPIDEARHQQDKSVKRVKYIKRIIGLPGETVEIRDAKIYINGAETPLEEDYLKEEWLIKNDGYTFQIPEGCYLMLGDNRNNSKDSRYWADEALKYGLAENEEDAVQFSFVKRDQILGKAYFRYWPLNKISSLY